MAGIGQEILCVLSGGLDISGHEESDPRIVVGERIARSWLAVKGSMRWAPNRGLGLSILMNNDMSRGDLGRLQTQAAREAELEDGVVSARVTASMTNGVLTLVGRIKLDVSGEFVLTVDASGAREVLLQ